MNPEARAFPADWHKEFPYNAPQGTEAYVFLQWKNTDVCIDFYCPCGMQSHFDGYFAHVLRCLNCGTDWELGTQVIVKRNTRTDGFTPRLLEDYEPW